MNVTSTEVLVGGLESRGGIQLTESIMSNPEKNAGNDVLCPVGLRKILSWQANGASNE